MVAVKRGEKKMWTALVHVLITSMVSSDMAKAAARGERIAGLSLSIAFEALTAILLATAALAR